MTAALATSSFIALAVREETANHPLLCGDEQIRTILNIEDKFDIERIKNIRFNDAYEKANAYLEKRRTEESGMIAKLDDLQDKWYASSSRATAGKQPLEESAIQEAIRTVITKAYSSVELASKNDCSLLPEDCPGHRDAYRTAEADFGSIFEPLLGQGKFMVSDVESVKKNCIQVIKPSLDGSVCYQLCSSLAAQAFALSARPAGTYHPSVPSTGELAGEIEVVRKQIDDARARIKDCEATRSGIAAYESKLRDIGSQHDMHGKLSREAQTRLRSVANYLEKVTQCSENQQQLLADLKQVVAKTNEQNAEVEDKLKKNQQTQVELKTSIQRVQEGLLSLQDVLQDSRKAVAAMQAFKAGTVVAMQNFVQIYNDAVRAPLHTLGLTRIMDNLSDDLWPNVKGEGQEKRWASSERYAQELKAECSDVASATSSMCRAPTGGAAVDAQLNATKQLTDMCEASKSLQQLCQRTAAPSSYVDNVREAVDEKQRNVREWLQKLKTELNELANSGVDSAGETGNIGKGEPEFLRRFTSVLNSTTFYKDFVEDWSLESPDGKLQTMTRVIGGILGQMTEKVQVATERFRSLNQELVASITEDSALHDKLTGISKVLAGESDAQIKLETKILEFKQVLTSKEEERRRFQAQLDAFTATLQQLQEQLAAEFSGFQAAAKTSFKAVDEHWAGAGIQKH